MRQLIFIIVLAAAAYYGWDYYQQHADTIVLPWQKTAEEVRQDGTPTAGASQPFARPPAEPEFVSKIRMPDAAPGQKPAAPPGRVYVTARTSVETANGIVAIVPGDTVTLLQTKANGAVRVTTGQADFELKPDQFTRDPEVAQAAEKRDFEARILRR